MAQIIPLGTYPDQTLTVELDGADYELHLRYLSRSQTWQMDLSTIDGVEIVKGVPCLLYSRVLRGNTNPLCPQGELIFFETTNTGAEAGKDDMGARVQLIYFSAAEVLSGSAI